MGTTFRSGHISALALIVGFAAAQPVAAQDVAAQGDGGAPATQIAAESANAANDAGSDDIVVTARRSEESIQSAPVSVSAFNGDALRDAGIQKTEDLMIKTPG